MQTKKFRILPKFSFLISALATLIFAVFSAYKGILLILIKKAMDDTFVGGETSDISIVLWLSISGIMFFLTFLFIYLRKIKELNSQKTITSGFIILWFLTFVMILFFIPEMKFFSLVPFGLLIIYILSYSNVKKQIIFEKRNKPLSPTEIHLLQKLAKRK